MLGFGWPISPAQALEPTPHYPSKPSGCSPLSKPQVESWFEGWNQALASGDPAQVTQRYGSDALLLPTLSAELRDTPEGISAYFTGFLMRSPNGTVTRRQILLGCNEAVDAGTYTFSLHNPEERVQARYTFVYGLENGEWRIVHHHSSVQPN